MSRSQKNARMGANAGVVAPQSTGTPTYPDVTQKDGAANIAGDVTAFSTDDYGPMKVVEECCD